MVRVMVRRVCTMSLTLGVALIGGGKSVGVRVRVRVRVRRSLCVCH